MRKSLTIGLAFALIVGTFAALAGPASADGTFTWQGNGFPNASCPSTNDGTAISMLWVFNDNGSAVPTSLTINGQVQTNLQTGNGTWTSGHKFLVAVNSTNYPPLTASVTYTGTLGNTVLTLSGCNEGGGPQTSSLTVFKNIPNVLQGSETATFTFQAILNNVVGGSCQITFTAGQTTGQCTITGLTPNTLYTIHEVPNPPWLTQPDSSATTGAAGTNTPGPTFNNNFGPATAQACKVTDVGTTGHDASTDTFTFDLKANGTTVETVTVAGGGTVSDPVCSSFNAALVEGTTYTIVEETPASGWTQDGIVCDVNGVGPVANFTPDYPNDADAIFTCTATNSITAAHATVQKVTVPSGHEAGFTFHLFADGVEVASWTSTDGSAHDFGVDLQDGVHYTVTEDSRAGWISDGGVGCDFTVHYPADSGRTFGCVFTNTQAAHATVRKVTVPAGSEAGFTFHLLANGVVVESWTSTGATAHQFSVDLQDGVHYTITEDPKAEWNSNGGVGCDFTVHYPADAGRTFDCVFTNTHASAGLTIGYWKNHLAANGSAGCSGLPNGTGCSKNGPFTKTYLPKSLGNYTVSTIQQAAAVFAANNCSSNTSQGAVACLAAQLLGAELNVANGASHCADTVIAQANAFLISPVGYTGPTGTYSLTSAQRSTAITLKSQLDTYNNGTCPI